MGIHITVDTHLQIVPLLLYSDTNIRSTHWPLTNIFSLQENAATPIDCYIYILSHRVWNVSPAGVEYTPQLWQEHDSLCIQLLNKLSEKYNISSPQTHHIIVSWTTRSILHEACNQLLHIYILATTTQKQIVACLHAQPCIISSICSIQKSENEAI